MPLISRIINFKINIFNSNRIILPSKFTILIYELLLIIFN